jgi:hypothetical protein
MPDSPNIKYGILKCRDLVELYYGARMVAALTENLYFLSATGQTQQILGADPRRISYEIIWESNVVGDLLYIGNQTQMDNFQAAVYKGGNESVVIKRSWLTDLDTVTLPLIARAGSTSPYEIFVREVFLTPIPIDELP